MKNIFRNNGGLVPHLFDIRVEVISINNLKRTLIRIYKHFWHDSLYRNSIYLMLSTVIMSAFGFVFWIICSRLYSPTQIGSATTVISAATMASVFSLLGFNNVNIRFIPIFKDKSKLLSTSFLVTGFASFIVSCLFFIWINTAHFIHAFKAPSMFIFILFFIYVFFITFNNLFDSIFIAYRSTMLLLIKNTIMSFSKLMLPFFLVSLSFWGIINSIVIAYFAALSFGFTILIYKFKFKPQLIIDKSILNQTRFFALGNFVGNIFGILPGTFVPILIAWKLGPAQTAFYYMPLMITTILKIIPSATSQSLFAEASHDESRLDYYLLKSIRGMFLALFTVIFCVLVFANLALYLFGHQYALHGANVLRVLSIASMISAVNYLGDTLLNIKKRMKLYVFMNIFNSLIIVTLVYCLVPLGLIWAAFGNLIGQVLTAIVYIFINRRLIKSLFR